MSLFENQMSLIILEDIMNMLNQNISKASQGK